MGVRLLSSSAFCFGLFRVFRVFRGGPLLFCLLCVFVVPLRAHPVPSKAHDRALVVRLTPEAVVVDYRLEIDEFTALNELLAILEKDEVAKLNTQNFRSTFVKTYGPILAGNLTA